MEQTKIQWTWQRIPLADGQILTIPGYTFNPWIGCMKVVKECQFCYAEGFARRWGWKVWGPASTTERRVTSAENWKKPLKWNREAAAQGYRRNVFCASLADIFEDHPGIVDARLELWKLIEQTPWLNWLLLTKRPENIVAMSPWERGSWPDNIWTGTSAGTQKTAQEKIPYLLEVPSVVRFVSCEPQLEYVDFSPWLRDLHWLICGGESGHHHRPFNPDWARANRNQCQEYGVPFFFKQHGGLRHDSGGRMLDGRTWDEVPLGAIYASR